MTFSTLSKWVDSILKGHDENKPFQSCPFGFWLVSLEETDHFYMDSRLSIGLDLGPEFCDRAFWEKSLLGKNQWEKLKRLDSKGASLRIDYHLSQGLIFFKVQVDVLEKNGQRFLWARHLEKLEAPWPKEARVAYNYLIKTNLEGDYLYYNSHYDEVFLGAYQKSRLGMNSMQDILPASQEAALKAAETVITSPGKVVDLRLDKLLPQAEILNTYWQFLSWPNEDGGVDAVYARGYDVSALERSEQSLEDRKRELELYYAFFENTYDALQVADVEGNLIYLNSEGSRRLGIPLADIQKYRVQDFESLFIENPKAWTQHVDFLRKNKVFKTKSRNRNLESGEELIVDVVVKMVKISGKEFIIANSRDITEEEEMRAEMQRKEEELALFFNNSLLGAFFMMLPEPIEWNEKSDKEKLLDWVFENQMVTRVNRALLDQYGYQTENEFIGYRPKDFFMHDLQEGRRIWRELFDRERWRLKTRERRKDDSEVIFEGDYVVIKDDADRILGLFGVQKDITESEQNQKDLEASKNQLMNLTEKIPGVVFQVEQKAQDLRLSFLSASFEALNIGISRDKVINEPSYFLERIDKGDYSLVLGSLLYAFRKQAPVSLEFRMNDAQGQERWFKAEARYKKNEDDSVTWFGVLSDRSEIKTAENEQRKLVHATKNVSDGILILDKDVRLDWINGAAEQLLGIRQENSKLQLVEELISLEPESEAAFEELILDMRDYRSAEVDLQVRAQEDARPLWLQFEHKPVWNANGEYLYGLLLIRNVDEMLSKQRELQQLLDLTADQNKRLQSFTYIVSHNIRSYAANFSGLLDAIEFTKDAAERDKLWAYLRDVSKGLDETIRNLSEVISVDSSLKQQKQELNLSDQVAAILKILKLEFGQVGAEVHNLIPDTIQLQVVPSYLESIILNLLTNTIRYRDPNRPLKVRVKYEATKKYHQFMVQDNGLGINLNKYGSRLFELYQTFHSNPKARGLGLYILKSQIEAMGGKVEVKSKVNQGSTFSVFFPKD